MGIDELVSRLERDAEARIAEVQASARAEVAAVSEAAERASARTRNEALAGIRARRRERLEREVAGARQVARAARLRAEYAFVERVLSRTRELLETLDRAPAYVASLHDRLAQASTFLDPRGVRARCRPALAPAVRVALAGREGVVVEEVTGMPGGFVLVAGDGAVEVDDTLPRRLERLRLRLQVELLAEVSR